MQVSLSLLSFSSYPSSDVLTAFYTLVSQELDPFLDRLRWTDNFNKDDAIDKYLLLGAFILLHRANMAAQEYTKFAFYGALSIAWRQMEESFLLDDV
jgi:hypothetical protein